MKRVLYLFLLLVGLQITAQKKDVSLKDAVLGYYKGLYPKSLQNLQWLEGTDDFMYVKDDALLLKDTENKTVKTISLADFKSIFSDANRFPYFEAATGDYLMYTKGSSKIVYYYKEGTYKKLKYPKNAENFDFNTKNKTLAYTVKNNLFLATTDNPSVEVTQNKNKNIVSGQAIARSEFGITKGIFWSSKANKLAFYQKDESNVADYPLVDTSVTPAKLNNIKYPMNGLGSEEPAVGVYDLSSHKTTFLKLFVDAGKEHYVTNLTWGPQENYIYLAEINRDQNHMWFNKYDVKTGAFVKTLFEEQNKKWVEPEHPAFFIPNGKNEFIWLSERDGFMNLYKYDSNGKFIKQLTHNQWVANDILGFSDKGRYAYVYGTGTDAREKHLFTVDTKRGKIKEVTPQSGYHYLMLNDNGTHYLDYFSNIDTPRTIFLGDTKAKSKLVLLNVDNPLKDYNLPKPELGSIKGEKDVTLYTRIFKPENFDASKKYPVLVYVYGGPHAQLVTNRWNGGAPLWMNWMASQGYIVFTVDGHGSDNRGFAFESVIHRQVGVIEMKDQLHGVDYLKSLPYVDADRIAVHGWSFGGFMTASLMTTYPDVFTTGVAGGPVTDWKWYEVMYGERYMDTEKQNKKGFEKTSVINKIQNLKGHLLTVHGYQDATVVPQHDIALQREAIKKDIQIDFYLYPAAEHNVRGRDRAHLMQKVLDYIIKNNK